MKRKLNVKITLNVSHCDLKFILKRYSKDQNNFYTLVKFTNFVSINMLSCISILIIVQLEFFKKLNSNKF